MHVFVAALDLLSHLLADEPRECDCLFLVTAARDNAAHQDRGRGFSKLGDRYAPGEKLHLANQCHLSLVALAHKQFSYAVLRHARPLVSSVGSPRHRHWAGEAGCSRECVCWRLPRTVSVRCPTLRADAWSGVPAHAWCRRP